MTQTKGQSDLRRPTKRPGFAPWTKPTHRHDTTYLTLSAKPLHVLLFVLPFIIAYEIGAALYLAGTAAGHVDNIRAHSMMLAFFQDLGVVGRFVPAILMITVLVAWHVLSRDRLRLKPIYLPAMAAEALLWTVPLLVLVALVQLSLGPANTLPPATQLAPQLSPQLSPQSPSLWDLSREARITVSIGAGLYEELLFRMIGLVILHAIFVDLFRVDDAAGTFIAIAISAVAFALYHDITGPDGQVLWPKALALTAAGAYFGLVYVLRGFGIVVGVHILYDLFVLVVLRST